MSRWRLILREMQHRWVNSALILVSVTLAVACLVATVMLLRAHDVATSDILSRMKTETEQRTSQLKDDYRKIVLTLGFNVFVMPAKVRPDQSHLAGLGGHEMPEAYVDKLANAGVITIDHLLPSLSAPVQWPEKKLQVILTGVRGEVTKAGKKRKRPLIQPVNPGEIVLGYQVAQLTGHHPGDELTLLDQTFQVTKIHAARGTQDDNTVWIDLGQAQELLGKPGLITSIQAINCLAPHCHPDATGIPSVTEEIVKVLPDTQVIIDMGKARARIDARRRAADEARAAMDAEAERRVKIRSQIDRFAAVLNPLVLAGAGLWIGLLMLTNVRERRSEIAILRTLGVTSRPIFLIFLGKSLIIGVLGAVLGYALGLFIGAVTSHTAPSQLIDPTVAVLVLICTPLLVAVASWIPANLAASQDPAPILNQD